MFEDLRSPAAKAKQAKRYAEFQKEMAASKKTRQDAIAQFYSAGFAWADIESCPFMAYENAGYQLSGCIFVTDMKSIALATVHKRFGTPIRMTKEPVMAMTDQGVQWIGGEYEAVDAPKWWFEWELTDVFGCMNYAGGEETGKDEVGFIATHWAPMPVLS